MESFELNKILGAALACLLLVTGVRLAADAIYAPPPAPGQTASLSAASAPPAQPEQTLAEYLAQGDPDRGKKQARKCASCHTFNSGGKNRVGPNLWNIIGQKFGHADGFNYSSAMKNHPGKWGYEEMDAFLKRPRNYLPGTKMSFAGLRKAQQRADLILYLRSLSPAPPALPGP